MTKQQKRPTAWVVKVLPIRPGCGRGGHARSKERVFYSAAEAQGYLAAVKRPTRLKVIYPGDDASRPATT